MDSQDGFHSGMVSVSMKAPYDIGSGSGRSLPLGLLISCAASAAFATLFSFYTIYLQLKNYRKPALQRHVVRLLVMVPIYSVASLISLFSLQAAFLIDLVRDLYEAFVIYSFFALLVEYLGGERSLLILLHGRPPTQHVFPVNLFFPRGMDASDPFTLLALKRGVLQYVQIKPILAILTVILKAAGKYEDGKLAWNNGYTWIAAAYNISVFLSLYCLGMFWACLSSDLQGFRVTSKFLCIKGIIFFSFWQGLAISVLVALGWITSIGAVADPDYLSISLQDSLICFEMTLFALAHAYAFSWTDYRDPYARHAARLPVPYALRDAVGLYDVFSDSLTTVRGTGYTYRTFEPSEGLVHSDLARERRSKAGLRYTQHGAAKYWLPQRSVPDALGDGSGGIADGSGGRSSGPLTRIRRYLNKRRMLAQGYAPLLPDQVAGAVHEDPEIVERKRREREEARKRAGGGGGEGSDEGRRSEEEEDGAFHGSGDLEAARTLLWRIPQAFRMWRDEDWLLDDDEDGEAESLTFGSPGGDEEAMYQSCRELSHGDYKYPNVDVGREERKREERDEEDRKLRRPLRRKLSLTGPEIAADESASKRNRKSLKGKGKGKGKASEDNGAVTKGHARKSSLKKREEDMTEEDRKHKRAKRLSWAAFDNPPSNVEAEGESEANSDDEEERGKVKGEGKRRTSSSSDSPPSKPPSPGVVDLVIEDKDAEERERILERRRGDPNMHAGGRTRIFRKVYEGNEIRSGSGTSTPNSNPEEPSSAHLQSTDMQHCADADAHPPAGQTSHPRDSSAGGKSEERERAYLDAYHKRIAEDLKDADDDEREKEAEAEAAETKEEQKPKDQESGSKDSDGVAGGEEKAEGGGVLDKASTILHSLPKTDGLLDTSTPADHAGSKPRGEVLTAEVGRDQVVSKDLSSEALEHVLGFEEGKH